MKWRTGMHVGRTIYLQAGPDPTKQDPLIGVMDTPGLAQQVVDAVNAEQGQAKRDWPISQDDLRTETLRTGGRVAGIRLIHVPTATVVDGDVETSQLAAQEKLIEELYAHPAVIEYYERLVT